MFSAAVGVVLPKYADARAVLDALLDLFDAHNSLLTVHPVQLRVCVFLADAIAANSLDPADPCFKATLKVMHDQILDNPAKFECLGPFVNDTAHLLHPPPAPAAANVPAKNDTLLRTLTASSTSSSSKQKAPSIFVRKSKLKKSWCEQFLELDSKAIAQQLTFLESSIFAAIESHDLLLNMNASKRVNEVKNDKLSSVDISIGHFNFISAWVITRVLMGRKPKSRAKMLIKFVQIATHLLALRNYNTLMSVILGLTSTPIVRMKQTQSLFQMNGQFGEQQNWASKLYELEQLMSSEKLFGRYRASLKDAELPCIPGVMFRDLIYIQEGNKDTFSDGSVNIGKALMLGDVILTLQHYQSRYLII
ncbi:Ras-specific guanine nucleotide-releasing factor RalGPS1 [Entophlyctis luteolus]|nr:Ras-specific guanine nucleotide-releasing factor RalGPS1 [Entophlyctis luteolus]